VNLTKILGIDVLVDEAEKYLQINDSFDMDISFWEQLQSRYAGYDVAFCYHNSAPPVEFLSSIGAAIVDDSIEMRLSKDEPLTAIAHDIHPIDESSFGEFAALHDRRNPDMYWTSGRVGEDLSRWGIFAGVTCGVMTGYVMMAMWDPAQAEIFCVEADNAERGLSLIIAAAQHAFLAGKPQVLYMADKGTMQRAAATSAGFRDTGYYQGFMVKT